MALIIRPHVTRIIIIVVVLLIIIIICKNVLSSKD